MDIWGVFWELSTERRDGGPLNWRSVRDCGKMIGIEPRLFSQMLRRMDDAYLSHKAGDGKTFTRDMMKR